MKFLSFLALVTPCILGVILTSTQTSADSWLTDPVIRAWWSNYQSDSLDIPDEISLAPLAKIKNGTVRGQIRYTGTTRIFRWLGLPFAKAPLNEFRFQVIHYKPINFFMQNIIMQSHDTEY